MIARHRLYAGAALDLATAATLGFAVARLTQPGEPTSANSTTLAAQPAAKECPHDTLVVSPQAIAASQIAIAAAGTGELDRAVIAAATVQATPKRTHARALELMPRLSERAVTGAWAGYVDSTPDGVPGIGEVDELPGVVLAAGFSGHGFGIGPGAGHLIADIISGATPIVDPKPYHPNRFRNSAWGKVAEF